VLLSSRKQAQELRKTAYASAADGNSRTGRGGGVRLLSRWGDGIVISRTGKGEVGGDVGGVDTENGWRNPKRAKKDICIAQGGDVGN